MSENCSHNCGSCSSNCGNRKPADFLVAPNPHSSIKKVIGVVSGKGGVGKSMVTSTLAVLKIDGNMAIAWSGSLNFTVERSGKTLIGSAASGEGLVNVFRGTGRVLMAPVLD